MNLLLINPNTSEPMTHAIAQAPPGKRIEAV
jgi:hypothetical protein